MNPANLAKDSEHSHQVALFAWCAYNVGKYPELEWYHAIKNEEKSGSVILGGKAKAAGIKTGVSDTFLPVKRGEFSGLYIELKKPSVKPVKATSKGGVSDDQRKFGAFVQSQGFGFAVCYGWEEARDMLIKYLQYS